MNDEWVDIFERHVLKTHWCWIWRTQTGRIYGPARYNRVSYKGRHYPAHRLSYELAKGPVPEGNVVRHMCNNAACVRPDHLDIGTPAQNCGDKTAVKEGRLWSGQRSHDYSLGPVSVDEILSAPLERAKAKRDEMARQADTLRAEVARLEAELEAVKERRPWWRRWTRG